VYIKDEMFCKSVFFRQTEVIWKQVLGTTKSKLIRLSKTQHFLQRFFFIQLAVLRCNVDFRNVEKTYNVDFYWPYSDSPTPRG
jgi:hypothetical protein